MTGTAPGAPAASASSVETPATGSASESARPRAVASPIRIPVKLPGPVPTTSASRLPGSAPAAARSSCASASTLTARERRSPRSSPSRTSAVEATSVAVSNARSNTAEDAFEQVFLGGLEGDQPTRVSVGQPRPKPHRGQVVSRRFRPFDEDDGVVEVRLEVTPLGRRDALEPEEVEGRDPDTAFVAVPDRVRRAGHGAVHPERPARAADERRLARAELARDGHDVAEPEPGGDGGANALGFLR